ncbi:MAG TPA: M4 family metallopeptidase, partial [Ilumatobacteraceae bacterium]|nr:M4 family metallopeptidase [Ilumatobacteraceae bacterium]
SPVSAVRFQQHYHGLPVFAGEIAVQIAVDGSVLSTSGEAMGAADVDVAPTMSANAATDTARNLAAKYDGVALESLSAAPPELWVYDPSLIGANGPPQPRLVWRIDVRTELGDVDRLVLIDAHSGSVALQFSQRENALNRSVCNNNNNPALPATCVSPVRTEGAPPLVGAGAADVNSAYDLSGVTYQFYLNSFGRDSVDGLGLPLKSTALFCSPVEPCPLTNAFWNGSQMVYGQGFATADDAVAHELTHGVTQFTSNLLYYAESGAINESMSDVLGELVDLSDVTSGPDPPADRWLLGEQLPGGAMRNMADPPSFNDPDKMTSPLYFGNISDSRGVHINSGVDNKAAFLITDGATFNGQTIVGLGTTKTALIYYQAETAMLGPGSDYLDLFHILPQACTNLVGTAGITAGDCTQVTKAVTATEMDKVPTTPGAHLSAPVCDAGSVQNSVLFSDDMETTNGNWATSATTAAALWGYFTGSSQSGVRSVHTADVGIVASSTLRGTFSVAVPPGTTYLRFDHSFEMDYDSANFYDGGVVEYSTNGGVTWKDAVSLPGPTVNGYNGTLDSRFGNPLAGRQAFSGPTPGYETTRIDLSTLSGSNVIMRFRVGSDSTLAFPGWFIDDVSFYTCAPVTPPAQPPTTPVLLPAGASFSSLVPARLLESRPGLSTIDGQFNDIGIRSTATTTALTVAGRGGVANDATAVVLNITVADAQAPGFITVYPCGSPQPTASNLNYVAGSTVANAVLVQIGAGGQVCIFNQSPTHLIADVNGYFAR